MQPSAPYVSLLPRNLCLSDIEVTVTGARPLVAEEQGGSGAAGRRPDGGRQHIREARSIRLAHDGIERYS